MAQYIDKAAIIAEIERLYKKWEMGNYVHEKLISFLNTLEVKEVNDDKWLIKATEWLSANLHRYDEGIGLSVEEFVERFKKAMGRI